jgi:hypothetical protein
MHGLLKVSQRQRQRQSPHRRFRNGKRAAALRAFTAATLYASGSAPSVAAAAVCCGSCVQYVRAAVILQRSENTSLIKEVVAGRVDLQRAGAQARRVADLISAYRRAADEDRVSFARACDAEQILNILAKASA